METIERYVRFLGTDVRKPSLPYLRSLIRLHLERIPFENISKIHYYLHRGRTGLIWLPPLETHLAGMEDRGLGGNCYVLNAHFGRLLQALGFQVDLVRAAGGNTHLALMVTVEGRSYYVDVGYGAPLFEPLLLEEQPRFTRFGEEVEITRLGDLRYLIDRRMNGQSFVAKCIEWQPVSLESFEETITHSLRDEDENPFMRRITATLFREGKAYSVINHKLLVKTDKGTEVHEYTRLSDWLEMLRATFGFQEDIVEEALDFLSSRGVDLFPA
jgi:N-hydroxyarylamine O-acetyltransferase